MRSSRRGDPARGCGCTAGRNVRQLGRQHRRCGIPMPRRNEPESDRSCTKGAATAAGLLRIRVMEHEALRQKRGVIVERRPVEKEVALAIDEDLGALRPLEYFIAKPRLALPAEDVAQSRAPATLDPHAQTTVGDALLGHQRLDLACGGFGDLNHGFRQEAASAARPSTRPWL